VEKNCKLVRGTVNQSPDNRGSTVISLHCPLKTRISHTILNPLITPEILHFTISMKWAEKNCFHLYSIVQIDLAYGTTSKEPEARRLML
jgi:hypothetical protein